MRVPREWCPRYGNKPPARGRSAMEDMLKDGYRMAWPIVFLLLAVFVGLVAHRGLTAALGQGARERPGLLLKSIVRHGQRPFAWLLPFLAVLVALPGAHLPSAWLFPVGRAGLVW